MLTTLIIILFNFKQAYVPHGGQEIAKQEFHVSFLTQKLIGIEFNHADYKKILQILTGVGFEWVPSANGHVPADAVVAGNQSNGESLYVGRANVSGSLSGKQSYCLKIVI